jgi:hypothetical protein
MQNPTLCRRGWVSDLLRDTLATKRPSFAFHGLTFCFRCERDAALKRPWAKSRGPSSEEVMLSTRSYTALSTAAALPSNRQSDWRCASVGMAFEHQTTGKPERGLGLTLA